MNRTASAGLLDREQGRPRVSQLLEFLEHGIRYVFVPRRSEIDSWHSNCLFRTAIERTFDAGPVRRLTTRCSLMATDRRVRTVRPPLTRKFAEVACSSGLIQKATVRGESLEPLYPSGVDAALPGRELHECLALVDALRIGRRARGSTSDRPARKKLRADVSPDDAVPSRSKSSPLGDLNFAT